MARTKLKFSPRGKPNRYQTYHHAAARPKLLADRIQSPILVAPTLLHRIESVDRVQEHRDLQAEAEDFLRASLLESEQDMDTTASGDNEVARSEETLRLAASELLTTPVCTFIILASARLSITRAHLPCNEKRMTRMTNWL